jgi:hypothetical protein
VSNSINSFKDDTKENFFKSATDVMTAYVASIKEKNEYRAFKLLPSPNRREIATLKAELLKEELLLQKALLQSKKRKILQSFNDDDELDNTCYTNTNSDQESE